jgi:hypothetical protein
MHECAPWMRRANQEALSAQRTEPGDQQQRSDDRR